MGKTQNYRPRTRYGQSSDAAYDEYINQVRENKRLRKKKRPHSSAASTSFALGSWEHWAHDCQQWRGMLLTGRYCHWCENWNGLPVDETCPEWPCGCNIVNEVDKDILK